MGAKVRNSAVCSVNWLTLGTIIFLAVSAVSVSPGFADYSSETFIIDGWSVTTHQMGAKVPLGNSCDYEWWHGCSPTSAGMIMGHYDRNGYGTNPLTNEYPNLVSGGVAEASTYGSGTFIANDAIASSGHIADFYSGGYGASGDDVSTPFHAFDCLADFMGTSQDACGNFNGSTTFWNDTDGDPLYASAFNTNHDWNDDGIDDREQSGVCGLFEYVDYCGYGSGNLGTDTNFFNQYIVGYNSNTKGFDFDDYKAEIDAGRPVLIHVEGHSMYGYGYDTGSDGSEETILLHDTWSAGEHTMTWGGAYPYGSTALDHVGVTCVTVTNGVPEPAVLMLLCGGAVPVLLRHRRKAKV